MRGDAVTDGLTGSILEMSMWLGKSAGQVFINGIFLGQGGGSLSKMIYSLEMDGSMKVI